MVASEDKSQARVFVSFTETLSFLGLSEKVEKE